MSAEAENPRQKLFNYLSNEHEVHLLENELDEILRIVGQHALSKKLEALTEEKIEGLFPDPELGEHFTNANNWKRVGAKILLNHLKKEL